MLPRIAWIQALGPASPLLRWLGIAPELGSTHPLYSREGLVLLLTLQHSPLVLLLVRASLRSFPRELSDAARVSGADGYRLLTRITLPLLGPTLLAGFATRVCRSAWQFWDQRPDRHSCPIHHAAGPRLATAGKLRPRRPARCCGAFRHPVSCRASGSSGSEPAATANALQPDRPAPGTLL